MTCEVDFSDESSDAEQVEMFERKVITARKAHTCVDCRGAIAKGESCARYSYKYEGEFSTEHRCDPCEEAAAEFEHRLVGGLFWLSMHEAWGEGANVQSCINRLTTARAKEHMRQQWLKWHDKMTAYRKRQKENRHGQRTREQGGATGEGPRES